MTRALPISDYSPSYYGHQLGTVVQTYPIFLNMDPGLRVKFLLLLRPIALLHEEYLYEALDIAEEAYFLTSGKSSELHICPLP